MRFPLEIQVEMASKQFKGEIGGGNLVMRLGEITTEIRMMKKNNPKTTTGEHRSGGGGGDENLFAKKVHDRVISQKSNEENV